MVMPGRRGAEANVCRRWQLTLSLAKLRNSEFLLARSLACAASGVAGRCRRLWSARAAAAGIEGWRPRRVCTASSRRRGLRWRRAQHGRLLSGWVRRMTKASGLDCARGCHPALSGINMRDSLYRGELVLDCRSAGWSRGAEKLSWLLLKSAAFRCCCARGAYLQATAIRVSD